MHSLKNFIGKPALTEKHVVVLQLGILIPSMMGRLISLINDYEMAAIESQHVLYIFRGINSDVFFSLVIGLVFSVILPKSRFIYAAWILFWSIFYSGNIDHITYNDTNINFLLVKYAVTKEFLVGSILVPAILTHALLFVFFTIAAQALISKTQLIIGNVHAFLIYVITGLFLLVPVNITLNNWTQQNVFESNIGHLSEHLKALSRSRTAIQNKITPELKEKYLKQDLSGTPRFAYTSQKPNILIIAIESLGAKYINNRNMPFLSEFARNSLHYTNFFAHQQITIRGLYSILSGQYPNLIYSDNKADIVGTFGSRHQLLPEILSDIGYQTIFIQSANLGFMRKDLFAKNSGFQHIYGEKDFKSWYLKGGWGVDDRALYEKSASIINSANKETPWMMMVLTSGTHPPFDIPADFKTPEHNSALDNSILYTDTYLKSFMEDLKNGDILKNTLVIITSDEVKGEYPHNIGGSIDHYRSPLIIKTPENYSEVVPMLFGHVDITLSILDYLRLPFPSKPIIGRSVFRRYSQPRSLLIGREQDMMILDDNAQVDFLSQDFSTHQSFQYNKDIKAFQPIRPDKNLPANIKSIIDYSDTLYSDVSTHQIFYEKDKTLFATPETASIDSVIIVGQLSMSAKTGDEFTWDIELNTDTLTKGEAQVTMSATIIPSDPANKFQDIFFETTPIGPNQTRHLKKTYTATKDIGRIDTHISIHIPSGESILLNYVNISRK